MVSDKVLINQMWPRRLKLEMAALAARKGVSVAELTRQALEAQYAAELYEGITGEEAPGAWG